VESYTDSIPVDPESPIWPMIRMLIEPTGRASVPSRDWEIIEQIVRPEVVVEGSAPLRRDRGVPTGQPISCVLFNLYLGELDRELGAIPGAFYARYSDDIVFAHPDAAVARKAAVRMEMLLTALDLRFKPAKSKDLYVTVAGRPSDDWPEAKGANGVTFLGLRVNADGTIGLEPAKARALVRDLRRRAQAAAAAADNPDEAARLACMMIRRALTPGDPDASTKSANLIRRVVTARHQLEELDLAIARALAGILTHDRSVRAFRDLPPRVLRERWGLPSLVASRNRVGRSKPTRRAGPTARNRAAITSGRRDPHRARGYGTRATANPAVVGSSTPASTEAHGAVRRADTSPADA